MKSKNNYKQYISNNKMRKRGQVAIFVIIAVVIVIGIVAYFLLAERGLEFFAPTEFTPTGFLKSCIEPEVEQAIESLSKNAGYSELEGEGTITYQGEEIKYLCYSSEYYQPCAVQQPLIKEHFERELANIIIPKTNQCAKNLVTEYEKRGYDITSGAVDANISMVPEKIRIDVTAPMRVTKGEETRTYEGFGVSIDNDMYNLIMISTSIVDFETTFGDTETTLFMQYYPDLKIEKTKLSDGTTIYVVSNVVTEENFRFASRSYAWPAGYGFD
jgi:hypothetical protein